MFALRMGMMDDIVKWLVGIVAGIAIALSGWALSMVHDMAGDMKVVKLQLEQITNDTDCDVKQSETLTKHWKLHGWARDEINTLRAEAGKPLAHWPDY